MAPVTASLTGVTRQTIDDQKLVNLLSRLSKHDGTGESEGGTKKKTHSVNVEELVADLESELDPKGRWRYQEQADLYEWVQPLNAIDAAMSQLMFENPGLLLVPGNSTNQTTLSPLAATTDIMTPEKQANSLADVFAVPASALYSLRTILRFLAMLLRNAANKLVFNSVHELSDLLAAADDEVSALALEALASLASPPLIHRLQAPELQQQHRTALHSVKLSDKGVHGRLVTMAKGWGSRGSGLGLVASVTADDTVSGQGSLPRHAGEVSFEFVAAPSVSSSAEANKNRPVASKNSDTGGGNIPPKNSSSLGQPPSRLINVHLSTDEILSSGKQGEKRRRMGSPDSDQPQRVNTGAQVTKSTAELFFQCLDRAGGRDNIPLERTFALLAEVRLARSFHSNKGRVAAVERRLKALIAVLYSNPSSDVVVGYFHAQPELCVEMVDLLRPMVSTASVSSSTSTTDEDAAAVAAISAVAESDVVPYEIRSSAVETLTAVVSRRDSPSGGLSKVARSTNILAELGIGKGQFLGLLPTLIRFSLGSLNSFLTHNGNSNASQKSAESNKPETEATDGNEPMVVEGDADDVLGVSVGLAFLEATKAPALPRRELEERALEFVDVVLTLTYSVVSVPSGTEALTNCGLIPALVSTVALESFSRRDRTMEESYAECLLHFISAQAIQILEGAIVTHTNAHTAFHDLKGVELLCRRLHLEIEAVKQLSSGERSEKATSSSPGSDAMDVDPPKSCASDVVMSDTRTAATRELNAARRVLLFSIVNCLTVIFHQHDSNNSTTAGTALGGTQLRKPELTAALKEIMDNVSSYGGVLAALTATLLSDVMNGDPQVVHYVHSSGLAESFLRMMSGRKIEVMEEETAGDVEVWEEPKFPASSELVVALPNVIAALALTQEGAEIVKKANPFDALLSIFCSPSFAMPRSRCLLNEMAAVVGTGLDEIMRHVSSLKPTVMAAVVRAIRRVVALGKQCSETEEREYSRMLDDRDKIVAGSREWWSLLSTETENYRTCLMQYAYNIGQLLEQMLHNEEHTVPFVEAGGLDGLLELYPILVPTNVQFLTYVSCLSCPSLARLTHSTTARALNVTIMNIATNYGPHKMLKKLTELLDRQLKKLFSSAKILAAESQSDENELENASNLEGVLDRVPNAALHNIESTRDNARVMSQLSYFLRDIVALEWFCDLLADTVRAACQRSQDGSGWGRIDREWKKEISSKAFEGLIESLSDIHRKAMSEVCRIRTDDTFDERERQRFWGPGEGGGASHPGIYRLRVVCPEGAVLRDGIEIDSCENVGGLELGEVIEAFDRCVNSSGVMRYRTRRGWLSEQTRGHGREPIVEVIGVSGQASLNQDTRSKTHTKGKKRIEFGVPDLRATAACVLARLQNSQVGIMSSLGRAIVAGMGSMPLRSLLLHQGTVGSHVPDLVRITTKGIAMCFDSFLGDTEKISVSEGAPSRRQAQQAMSLGCAVSLLYSCLFEEKRDRQIVNLPVLGALLHTDGVKGVLCNTGELSESEINAPDLAAPEVGLFGAIRTVWSFCVQDMASLKSNSPSRGDARRLSRAAAACLPPTIALLRRLMSRSLVVESQMGSVMAKMKSQDISRLLCDRDRLEHPDEESHRYFFKPSVFASSLHCNIADLLRRLWTDPGLKGAPTHVVYPIVSLVGDVMNCLEDAANASPENEGTADISRRSDPRRWMLGGDDSDGADRSGGNNPVIRPPEPFEPSESTVSRLLEMGFSRDHALEALEVTESNALEVAMEYALSHPPPSPTSALRRQQQRDERRRQREASTQVNGTETGTSDASGTATETSTGGGSNANAASTDGATSNTDDSRRGDDTAEAPERSNAAENVGTSRTTLSTGTSAEEGPDATTGPINEATERNEENASAVGTSGEAPERNEENASAAGTSGEATERNEENASAAGTRGEATERNEENASAVGTSGSAMEQDAAESVLATEPMDVESGTSGVPRAKKDKDGKASENEGVSELDQKECTEKALEKRSIAVAKSLLSSMKGRTITVSTELLVKGSPGSKDESATAEFEGDSEALTVVLTSFLLDICGRYPSQRSETVLALLGQLDSLIVYEDSMSSHRVVEERERDFASYCYAAALVLRALPRTRPLLLRFGLVRKLLDCCTNVVSDGQQQTDGTIWLTHAFILLDVMAQATAAVPEIDEIEQNTDSKISASSVSNELELVQAEHKAQKAELSRLAVDLTSALNSKITKKKSGNVGVSKADSGADGENSDKMVDIEAKGAETNSAKSTDDLTTTSSSFPTYLPLIPASSAERCMLLCVDFLRCHSNGSADSQKGIRAPIPGLLHAVLLLLARVLRTHKLAGQFLRLGGADFIVSLPSSSRFEGMTGLVTVILRRTLEDEPTLRTAMEAEIRGTMMKLHRKKSRGLSSESEQPSVTARTFVQAITPLLCRDPGCFLKAAAVSVRLDSESGDSTQHRFTLLTQEERSKNSELLESSLRQRASDSNESDIKGDKGTTTSAATGSAKKRGRLAQKEKKGLQSRSSAKSKSPRRSSKRGSGSPRRPPKQERRDRRSSATFDIQLNGSAANHVTSLLLSELMKSVERQRRGATGYDLDLGGDVEGEPEAPSFLLIVDYLEIIADLVLAVPACAAAIHRFKPNRSEDKLDSQGIKHPLHVFEHALAGSPKPPKTAVSYLLHCLLPQPRIPWTQSNDDDSESESNADKKVSTKKDEAFVRVKIAQTSARLLVTLVARAGEGRRRVVTDLAFALSGGQLVSSGTHKDKGRVQSVSKGIIDDHEMWALQSWGELCGGLAAPRSSGMDHDSNYGSQQSDSSLSLEVVKLMFECGMPHALMHGIKRIRLEHPLASNTAAALLRPLEMFTRGSVIDAVREMAEKEHEDEKKKLSSVANKPAKKDEDPLTRRTTIGPSSRGEQSFSDDAMLEDGFDAETAARSARRTRTSREPLDIQDFVEGIVNRMGYEEEDDDDDDDDDDEMGGMNADEFVVDAEDAEAHVNVEDEGVELEEEVGAESGGDDAEEYESDESSQSDAEDSEDDEENEDDDEDDDDDMEEEEEEDDEVEDMEDDDEDADNDIDDDPQVNEFFDGDVDADGPVDEVTGGIEVEEGWTRVDPGRSGSLFLGMRSGTSPSQGGRQRNILLGDPSDPMVIGNILLGGDLQNPNQLDALAHVEDLGIRLGYGTRVRVNRISSAGDTGQTTATRRNDDRNSDGSPNMNSGPVGTVAAVRQRNPPDSGYSSSNTAGRLSEPNAMEYIYGGPSSAVGGRNYDFTIDAGPDDGIEYRGIFQVPNTFDVHLFPGGSAASTHTRTQQFLHPLLSGVELPPVNALIPALRNFGVRSRRGASNVLTNDSDTGTSALFGRAFMSDSFGHVIRVSRGAPTAMGSQASSSGGAVGAWTDDGQPLDTTAEDFGRVFEQSLTAIIRAESERVAQSPETNRSANQPNETAEAQEASSAEETPTTAPYERRTTAVEGAAASSGNNPEEGTAEGENEEADQPAGAAREGGDNMATDDGDGDQPSPNEAEAGPTNAQAENSTSDNPSSMNEDQENEGAGSEGDVVANSLAAGLNLSPDSENGRAGRDADSEDGRAGRDVSCDQVEATHTLDPNRDEPMSPEESAERETSTNNAGQVETGMETMETDEQTVPLSAEDETTENTPAAGAVAEQPPQATDRPAADAESSVDVAAAQDDSGSGDAEEAVQQNGGPNENGLVCPPGMDLDVFNCLPIEMQREVVENHQTTTEVAAQLDAASGLDPEALAALPEDVRLEVIAQEQQERRLREQTPADPSNAQEMDNASFVASLSPELREEILVTSDDTFLNSLPPNIQAEAQVLRERAAASRQRRSHDPVIEARNSEAGRSATSSSAPVGNDPSSGGGETGNRKKNRTGRLKVDCDRTATIYIPDAMEKDIGSLWTSGSIKALCRLMYLLSPVRPQRLMQKLILNLCGSSDLRRVLIDSFVALLNDDPKTALFALDALAEDAQPAGGQESCPDIEFPPPSLIGTAPLMESESSRFGVSTFRRRHSTSSAVVAASMPSGARGSTYDDRVPPIVARRIVESMIYLSKSAPRVCFELLGRTTSGGDTNLEHLLSLLKHPLYAKSSSNLEQLLSLLDAVVAPLSLLPRDVDSQDELSHKDAETTQGKEYVNVPRTEVAPSRLHLFCSVLRLESCKESAMIKVNTIAKRLCRVESNRTCILQELASVAQALGGDAIRDLRALSIRLQEATNLQHKHKGSAQDSPDGETMALSEQHSIDQFLGRASSSAVTLSTSTSELKLLRVLQTLHSLCGDGQDENGHRRREGNSVASKELVRILKSIELESLWEQLGGCLKLVSVLEGVAINGGEEDTSDESDGDGDGGRDENESALTGGKTLQNSVAGLLSRFLPTIEAFFVVNGSYVVKTDGSEDSPRVNSDASGETADTPNSERLAVADEQESAPPSKEHDASCLVGGRRLIDFVSSNKVLLNALLRSNPGLIEKGLKALVQVPSCKPFLDFDVKRQWFKTQIRRQRHRRAGSLRLSIRRKHVFEDTYHQLRLRNADEMRGRLSVTFHNEEGVDAGGLSREFFAILAKEMFNPNYALFTSTEDGCTFQPNPNSSINPDHLSYFRFVGRIVGKAVLDGYLLDAHFTRSLYKHMLQVEPTHHDMQAIDPDYYKNLKTILEYKLEDIGLDLTFSIEDYSFGRSQIIGLIPNGETVKVTEETKAKYVGLVCHHRMTASIQEQIKAYLAGFHELVKPDLISIFTAKELELLISGMPDIDMNDLKTNTEYQGFKATDQEITWFWNVMFTLSRSEKAAFLQFVTGSSKVPLNGFSDLQGMRGTQKFSIHKAGGANGALMSAHTCFNALDLPVYKSEEETREKLLYAISEGAGAFLFA